MNKLYILLPFLFIIVSCNSGSNNKNEVKTATLAGPSAMAMIQMIDEKPVLETTPTSFIIKNEPNQIKAMILNEEVEFAVVPSTMGALLYNKTGKYILAAIPVWGTLYLFGSDTTVTSWSGLKGKKISLIARGMTPDIMFRYLAQEHGLDPESDFTTDYSFPGHIELANAVAAEIASLGVISEPLVSLAMKKNPRVKPIINFNQEWIDVFGEDVPFAQTALLVKKQFAKEHPEKVNEYLDKLQKSIIWVNTHHQKASELIVKHGILPDTAVARHSIPLCNLHYSQAREEMNGIQEYFKVFYNFNPLIIGEKLPNEDFYYKKQDL